MGFLIEFVLEAALHCSRSITQSILWLLGYNEDWESIRPGAKRRPVRDALICAAVFVAVIAGIVAIACVFTQ